jgi:serine/threonine protein kinase
MAYSFTGLQVQRLYGQALSIKNIASNAVEQIEIQDKKLGTARSGLEGYGLRAVHRHQSRGNVDAFLKVFKQDIPQRHERSEFLVRLGLAKHHEWVFQGVPYGWLNRQRVNGVEIVGHLTKFVGLQYGDAAKDFDQLKMEGTWDAVPPEKRRAFSAHLASAVCGLERLQFVHGDLSPGNIMVGPGPGGRDVCCLCDFDGFHHPTQPPIPRKFEGELTRPLGNPEYRYPELIDKINHDASEQDDTIIVETDRFALAALVCEMMTWDSALVGRLGRPQLLDENIIGSRSLSDLPDDLRSKFPEGFFLLEKALQAGSIQDMPGPDEWLNTLGVQSALPRPFNTSPQVLFYRRKGTSRKLYRHAALTSKASDTFNAVHPELLGVRFERDNANRVILTINSPLPCALRRRGSQRVLTPEAKASLAIYPGDLLRLGDWEISFEESSTF